MLKYVSNHNKANCTITSINSINNDESIPKIRLKLTTQQSEQLVLYDIQTNDNANRNK